MKFKNLMISGGGIYGISMVGIIKELKKYNFLDNLKKFFGTSVGAIICLLLVVDYSIDEIIEFILNFNFKLLINNSNNLFDNLSSNFGFYDNKNMRCILNNLLTAKNFNYNITFQELYNLTSKELIINVSCINKSHNLYISHNTYPNYNVIDIVIASCSIPILFYPFKYDNNYLLDGGLFNNIPINYFEDELEESIIIAHKQTELLNFDNLENYLLNILISMYNQSNKINYEVKNLIFYENYNDINFTKFELDCDEKNKLFNNGLNIGKSFIKNNYYYKYFIEKKLNINIYE